MRLLAALTGDLKKVMAAELAAAEQAVGTGVSAATDGLKGELRAQVSAAGLGETLAKTWQSKLYPRNGRSVNAAGFVYSKAPQIISAFANGATIRTPSGKYLAIPTQYVGKRGGRRMRPADYVAAGKALRFVPPQGARRYGLLVLDDQRITSKGRTRNASVMAVAKGKTATVILFILVPQVRLGKRLDIDGPAQRWSAALPGLVSRNYPDVSDK